MAETTRIELPLFYHQCLAKDAYKVSEDGVIRFKLSDELFDAFNQPGGVRVDSGDVYVSSYSKSGTQWVWSIVGQILVRGDMEKATQIKHNPPLDVLPSFEAFQAKLKVLNELEGHRIFQNHLYFHELPLPVQQGRCKIVHVLRNPKDVCVSYYHFHRMNKILGEFSGTWQEFLEQFMKGQVFNGNWFDYVLNWWQYRDKLHVLFVKYEELKKNNLEQIKRIADFLEHDLTDEEVKNIAKNTGFKAVRKQFDEKLEESVGPQILNFKVSHFIRKGEIGDWKNNFTVAQNEAFDEVYKKKMEGSDLHVEFE